MQILFEAPSGASTCGSPELCQRCPPRLLGLACSSSSHSHALEREAKQQHFPQHLL